MTVFAPGAGKVRAAGFSVTPLVVNIGEPFSFDIAMAGLDSPDGIFVEGTEQAVSIVINPDFESPFRGNCTTSRGIPHATFLNWGKDWLITGPDANWTYPFPNPDCNPINGIGPGDYVVFINYHRTDGNGLVSVHHTENTRITVLPPAVLNVDPVETVSGGSVRLTIDTVDGGIGKWAATALQLNVVGPCSGSYVFPGGDASWGQDRTLTFPSTEFTPACGNLGLGGSYQAQLSYRLRYPNGVIGGPKFLVKNFTVKPITLGVIGPTLGELNANIGIVDVIATGPYGEAITSLQVQCPGGATDSMTASALQALNNALVPGNGGRGVFWPSSSFAGPCELMIAGNYQVMLTSLHQSKSISFSFVGTVDSDGDTWPDSIDNCDDIPNPGQEDNDSDGSGDPCDDSDDGDHVDDSIDNCPLIANEDQANFDGDREGGDLCDDDDDNDEVLDIQPDNCHYAYNPGQEDANLNGIGNACDFLSDTDNDGLNDEQETQAGTDPTAPTPLNEGINTYTDGETTDSSTPVIEGDTVVVAILPPAGVDEVQVTVTDPDGNTAYEDILIPQSPVLFSFTADSPGEWKIFASAYTDSVFTLDYRQTLTVLADLPTPHNAEACKADGWKTLYRANGTSFKNQGDCVSYVRTGK